MSELSQTFIQNIERLKRNREESHGFRNLQRIYREEFGLTGLKTAFSHGPNPTEDDPGLYNALRFDYEVRHLTNDPVKLHAKVNRLGAFIGGLVDLQSRPVTQTIPFQRPDVKERIVHRLTPALVGPFMAFHGSLENYVENVCMASITGSEIEPIDVYNAASEVCKRVVPERWMNEEELPAILPSEHFDAVGMYLDELVLQTFVKPQTS